METNAPRLTEFSHGAGCGCKLGPGELRTVLDLLAPVAHPDLVVGSATGDDAAVWRLGERTLVATVDFFTPIVDDARTWGRIAAVNAASDIYAMGGRPLFALNIVAWPRDALPLELLAEVLGGAADAAAEGGWVAVGGHSVDDPEPKFGLAVVGEADADRVLVNTGLRPGDALVLTKPLGVGLVTTGLKRGQADASAVDAAIASMCLLNGEAASAALDAGATGATDVTGFGLLGHLAKMAEASGVDADVEVRSVPLLDGARGLAEAGCVPGGTARNMDFVRGRVDEGAASETDLLLLADPQTSGGLLFGAEPRRAEEAVARLREQGHAAAVIGAVRRGSGTLTLR
jgi:selenide,water dikinase